MKYLDKFLAIGMLVFAIGFNLWLYRLEPTATIDPNDNAFQYALIDRTNAVWDFSDKYCAEKFPSFFGHWDFRFGICQIGYLVDHWVPNWAEGYNLPYYYSHLPQVVIVGSYRFFNSFISLFGYSFISLFTYYHWVIYLLLCLFPISVFWSLRVIKLPWLAVGFGALVASQISTDGLHGLDPASYLWRGYGLTSQLFAQIWLPLAIAYSWRHLNQKETNPKHKILNPKQYQNSNTQNSKSLQKFGIRIWDLFRISDLGFRISGLWPAVFFLTLTTAAHLGVGMMALISVAVMGTTNIVLMSLRSASWRNGNLIMHKIASPAKPDRNDSQVITRLINLSLLVLAPILILSYWIVPIFLHGDYHNISFWDPVWKFNSLGAKEVLRLLFNGEIFDFGRFPWLTGLTFVGLFATFKLSLRGVLTLSRDDAAISYSDGIASPAEPDRNDTVHEPWTMNFEPLAMLFIFWLIMYFGRTTWGNILNLIPGMSEFHQHRFVVGVHLAGFFLIPIGASWLATNLSDYVNKFLKLNLRFIYSFISLLVYSFISLLVMPQTMKYAKFNDELILRANANHANVKADEELLFQTLKSLFTLRSLGEGGPSGRVFAGRGGGWGKDFRVAETPWYMNLSTYGIPTVLWLPETWSPNSDIEQYFSEDQLKDYDLFGIRYVVAPVKQKPQPFWKEIKQAETWKLYEIDNSPQPAETAGIPPLNLSTSLETGLRGGEGELSPISYFALGIRPAVVSTKKTDYVNLVRLWIQSDYHKQKLFPELRVTGDFVTTPLPHFRMLDESRYQTRDGKIYGLFGDKPTYSAFAPPFAEATGGEKASADEATEQFKRIIISSESNVADMVFNAQVEVKEACPECLVILKQSAHPNWKAYIDGKRVPTLITFPFYTAVKLETPGTYQITFKYEPSGLKMFLLGVVLLYVLIIRLLRHLRSSQ